MSKETTRKMRSMKRYIRKLEENPRECFIKKIKKMCFKNRLKLAFRILLNKEI